MKNYFIEDIPAYIEHWMQQKPFRELSAMQQEEVLLHMDAAGYDEMHELMQCSKELLAEVPGIDSSFDRHLRERLGTMTAARKRYPMASLLHSLNTLVVKVMRYPVPAYQMVMACCLMAMMIVLLSNRGAMLPAKAEKVYVHDTLYLEKGGGDKQMADSHSVFAKHISVQQHHKKLFDSISSLMNAPAADSDMAPSHTSHFREEKEHLKGDRASYNEEHRSMPYREDTSVLEYAPPRL